MQKTNSLEKLLAKNEKNGEKMRYTTENDDSQEQNCRKQTYKIDTVAQSEASCPESFRNKVHRKFLLFPQQCNFRKTPGGEASWIFNKSQILKTFN